MSGTTDLVRHQHDDDEIEHLHKFLREIFCKHFSVINSAVDNLSEEEIVELTEYIRYFVRTHDKDSLSSDTSVDKMKAFLLLFSKLSDTEHADRVLSYLESVEFGWHGNSYYLSNPCLRRSLNDTRSHCKKADKISSPELAMDILGDVYDIFFYNDFSPITLLVFTYCLASVHSSMLNSGGVSAPFFLQIAVDKSSVAYQVLKEIIEISDVNSGLAEKCNKVNSVFGQCDYFHQIYFPTQSITKDIENLIRDSNDCPLLIVGHENERNYTALLREIANIPTKKRALDLGNRFNLLPVFVCPVIKSTFDNVFNIDLTDFEVSTKYLALVKKNKQRLASWVLELVTSADKYQSQEAEIADRRRIAENRSIISSIMRPYINQACQQYPYLALDNAKNVGFLNFFFNRYLDTIRRLCTFPADAKLEFFESNNVPLEQSIKEIMVTLTKESGRSLAQLHHRYLPAPTETGINNRDAMRLAKQIEKHYSALKVYIRVIPVDIKNDRYIFRVETLQKTEDNAVVSKLETVQHRLKKYECFRIDMTDQREIKLIVAEKQLQDSNLLDILEDTAFSNPKNKIPYAIGIDETGQPYIADIAEFPHLLLGGSTNSGKSTAIRSLLLSVAYRHRTGDAYVIIMDLLSSTDESPFSVFNGHPIMACPVIQEPMKAAKMIFTLQRIMKSRPRDRPASEVPYIICVIDEFPNLYNDLSKEYVNMVKSAMKSLLNMGRHANIHLILAAQDPSKKDVDDLPNARARIVFYCSHFRYSVNIIGRGDAAKLQGKGQMIFNSEFVRGKRLLGSYIDGAGMKKLLDDTRISFVQKNPHRVVLSLPDTETIDIPSDDIALTSDVSTSMSKKESRFKAFEELLPDAIMWILPQEKVANSRLLKYLHVRDAMGKQILEWMAKQNLIARLNGNHGWEVKVESYEDITETVISVLSNAGYTKENIVDELAKRKK